MAIQEITSAEYSAVIVKGKVVVSFMSPKCGPCLMLGLILEEMSKDAELSDVKFYKLDAEKAAELREALQLTAVPMTVIYVDGIRVKDFIGVQDVGIMKATLVN